MVGLTANQMRAMAHAAELADVPFAKLTTVMTSLQGRLQMAQEKGKGTVFDAIQSLGIDIDKLTKLRPDQQIGTIGDALKKLTDPNDRLAKLQEILGGRANSLMGLFLEGSQGIADAAKDLKDFGAEIDDDTVRQAKAYADAIGQMKLGMEGLRNALAKDLGEDLAKIAKAMSDMVRDAPEIKAIGESLGVLGKGLLAAIKSALTVVQSVRAVVTGIQDAIGLVYAVGRIT